MKINLKYIVENNEEGKRLDFHLTSQDGIFSRAHAQRLLKSGNVLLNGKVELSPSRIVRKGNHILVHIPKPDKLEIIPEDGQLDILFEDEHLVVINKMPGIVVHPSPGHKSGTIVNFLLHHCQDLSGIGGFLRPGIVHRLDKDTSGILVAAKTDNSHRHLSLQFKKHSVKRQYQAMVWGVPEKDYGVINAALGRHPVRRKDISIVEKINHGMYRIDKGKHAVTHWRVLKRFKISTLMACRLETGRTHQIRVHLTSIGHPIVGDMQYGKSQMRKNNSVSEELCKTISCFPRQALHAEILGFEHPSSGEWLEFSVKIPEDFQKLVKSVQND